MVRKLIGRCTAVVAGAVFAVAMSAAPAHAATIWTDWTAASNGSPGVATGVLPGVGVLYIGELDGSVVNGTSGIWSPNSTFIGGNVTTSPSVVNDDLRLNGSPAGLINTIIFSSPVVDPVIAIWSLGQPGLTAAFNFSANATFQAGGPNSQYGGSPIVVVGNTVLGNEGNGVVAFTGTFTSLNFTNTAENFYAFTVGVNGPAAPEPMTLTLLGVGVVGLVARRRAKR